MPSFPPIPPEIKGIAHYMKVAEEHDERDIVISYWSRMYACQIAMKIMEGQTKPPEVTTILVSLMDWLESIKQSNPDLEGIHNNVCAQALIENYALQLFNYADQQDRAESFGKNVVKAFYTCGILMDVLSQFGSPTEDIREKKKYAKWKAAYIHNCLKSGELPRPGCSSFGDNDNLIRIEDVDDSKPTPSTSTQPTDTPSPSTASHPPFYQTPIVQNTPAQPPPNAAQTPTPTSAASGWPDLPSVPSYDPTNPQPAPTFPNVSPVSTVTPTTNLAPEQMQKAQKYCKWAGSALNYDDIKTAIDNLQKALHLLQYGDEK